MYYVVLSLIGRPMPIQGHKKNFTNSLLACTLLCGIGFPVWLRNYRIRGLEEVGSFTSDVDSILPSARRPKKTEFKLNT